MHWLVRHAWTTFKHLLATSSSNSPVQSNKHERVYEQNKSNLEMQERHIRVQIVSSSHLISTSALQNLVKQGFTYFMDLHVRIGNIFGVKCKWFGMVNAPINMSRKSLSHLTSFNYSLSSPGGHAAPSPHPANPFAVAMIQNKSTFLLDTWFGGGDLQVSSETHLNQVILEFYLQDPNQVASKRHAQQTLGFRKVSIGTCRSQHPFFGHGDLQDHLFCLH